MEDLIPKRFDLVVVELLVALNIFITSGILGNEGALSDELAKVVEVLPAAKVIDVGH